LNHQPRAELKNWSALILAAGGSRRFGADKLLADMVGEPVLARTVRAVSAVGFGEVAVVTRDEDKPLSAALSGLSCLIVHALNWEEGIAASIRAGVSALHHNSDGLFLFLGDMPLVPVELCKELADLAKTSGYAARPLCGDVPGHPVAFVAGALGDLISVKGDEGAGSLLRSAGARLAYLPTTDEGAILDVDTPEDLAAAERLWKSRFTSEMMDSAMSRGDLPKP
jgi:molybdenum cofactor cytidylyltransferase